MRLYACIYTRLHTRTQAERTHILSYDITLCKNILTYTHYKCTIRITVYYTFIRISVCAGACMLFRSHARSLARSKIRSAFRSLARSKIRSHARSSIRSEVRSTGRSLIRSASRSCDRSFSIKKHISINAVCAYNRLRHIHAYNI